MAEKVQQKAFTYACHKIDADGNRTGLVSEEAKIVAAPTAEAARIKVLTRLAAEKQYNPDKPNVEVDIVPFSRATA